MTPPDVPRFDQPAPGAQPRAVQFRTLGDFHTLGPAPERRGFFRRRGFLGVLGAGAITLGMTVLGWIPLARPARAEAGTEFPDCGRYSNGPGGPICTGAPYSPDYCGDDDWFITGCYERPGGQHVCYQPTRACRANPETNEGRNAWRWQNEDILYRCADGHAYFDGAPNPELLICNAKLTPDPPTFTPEPSEPPTTSPSPSPPPGPPALPDLVPDLDLPPLQR